MKASTGNERARRFRQSMRRNGYVQIGPWVHRDDKERVMNYIAKVNKDRENKKHDNGY